ncbi:hypothetical protein B4140_3269 [Bacillus amyloliquefaciens]|nr:hypothetical protein B4140_3269 [Bacillus amyloliquefaciens]
MSDLYSRLSKDDAAVLLVDHQTGLISGLALMNLRTMYWLSVIRLNSLIYRLF